MSEQVQKFEGVVSSIAQLIASQNLKYETNKTNKQSAVNAYAMMQMRQKRMQKNRTLLTGPLGDTSEPVTKGAVLGT